MNEALATDARVLVAFAMVLAVGLYAMALIVARATTWVLDRWIVPAVVWALLSTAWGVHHIRQHLSQMSLGRALGICARLARQVPSRRAAVLCAAPAEVRRVLDPHRLSPASDALWRIDDAVLNAATELSDEDLRNAPLTFLVDASDEMRKHRFTRLSK